MRLPSLTPSFARAIVKVFMTFEAIARALLLTTSKRHSFCGILRRKALLILVSFVIATSGTVAFPANAAAHPRKEHKRDYKREIEVVEEQWRAAQLAGDVAIMDKLLADDYFGISVAGQLNNKTQQLERLRTRSLELTRIDVSDVKIKLFGRVGIVTSLAQIEGVNDGESMRGIYRYTRVYKRYSDGSWKITNFEVTRVPGPGDVDAPRKR